MPRPLHSKLGREWSHAEMGWVEQVWNRRPMQVGRELRLHMSLGAYETSWWTCPGCKNLGRGSEQLGLEPWSSDPKAKNRFLAT